MHSSHETCTRTATIVLSAVCGAQQRGSSRGRVSARAGGGCRCSGETSCCYSTLTEHRRRAAWRKPPAQQRTRPNTRHCVVLSEKATVVGRSVPAVEAARRKSGQRESKHFRACPRCSQRAPRLAAGVPPRYTQIRGAGARHTALRQFWGERKPAGVLGLVGKEVSTCLLEPATTF